MLMGAGEQAFPYSVGGSITGPTPREGDLMMSIKVTNACTL